MRPGIGVDAACSTQLSEQLGVDNVELEPELVGVVNPAWMVRSDEFSPAFDALSSNPRIGSSRIGTNGVVKAEHAPAETLARFDDRDIVANAGEFVRSSQAGETRADDDDALALLHRVEIRAGLF